MALVGLLGHSMANGHSGAKGTWAPGQTVARHLVARALGAASKIVAVDEWEGTPKTQRHNL